MKIEQGATQSGIMPVRYERAFRNDHIYICSPYVKALGIVRDEPSEEIHDASWEAFNEHFLPSYFDAGIHALKRNIRRLEKVAEPYSSVDEEQLLFMVESLIHARRLLEEIAQ